MADANYPPIDPAYDAPAAPVLPVAPVSDVPASSGTIPADTFPVPSDLAISLLRMAVEKVEKKAATLPVAAIVRPSPSFLQGKKSYILAASGFFTCLGSGLSLYANGTLDAHTALTLVLGALGSGGLATIRMAISDHFGQLGDVLFNQILQALQSQSTAGE